MAETQTLTVTDFLLARIAEDEAVANHLRRPSEGDPWGWQPKPHPLTTCGHGSVQVHVNPARVLAECEAKRQIVEDHRNPEGTDWCLRCVESNYDNTPHPCPTLRAVAAVYADHDDYRDEWRA